MKRWILVFSFVVYALLIVYLWTKNLLGDISGAVTILVAFPVFLTWWEIWFGARRRQRKYYESVKNSTGNYPAVLMVSMGQNPTRRMVDSGPAATGEMATQPTVFDIRADVQKYFRNAHKSKKSYPDVLRDETNPKPKEEMIDLNQLEKDGRLFEIKSHQEKVTPEDMPDISNQILEKANLIKLTACTDLHVFYGGVIAGALVLGAVLGNRGRVHIYQYDRDLGDYRAFGPLQP